MNVDELNRWGDCFFLQKFDRIIKQEKREERKADGIQRPRRTDIELDDVIIIYHLTSGYFLSKSNRL